MSLDELQNKYKQVRGEYENSSFLLSGVRQAYREEQDFRKVLVKLKEFVTTIQKEDRYANVYKLDENDEDLTRTQVRHVLEGVFAKEDVRLTELVQAMYGLEHEINDLKIKMKGQENG